MDESGRKITKIAREAGKFTLKMMKEEGIGTAEFDFYPFHPAQSRRHTGRKSESS